jgi:hypothetical protein
MLCRYIRLSVIGISFLNKNIENYYHLSIYEILDANSSNFQAVGRRLLFACHFIDVHPRSWSKRLFLELLDVLAGRSIFRENDTMINPSHSINIYRQNWDETPKSRHSYLTGGHMCPCTSGRARSRARGVGAAGFVQAFRRVKARPNRRSGPPQQCGVQVGATLTGEAA